ncbi:MAG: hypothetical protein E7254_04340 [Lachnospiraceae bacterium]|nr:hypothetical protein [Lachnospiraceae bacterium]
MFKIKIDKYHSKNNHLNKRFIACCLIMSLIFSWGYVEPLNGVFAAVSEYGVSDDGLWAYHILDKDNKTVSIRPKTLRNIKNLSKLVIPSELSIQGTTYTVTRISENAFSSCVCDRCLNRNMVNLQDAWEDKSGSYNSEIVEVTVREFVVPSSVMEIGEFGFEDIISEKMTFEVTPNLKKIEDNAFDGCTLENFTIPASVTEMGTEVFSNGDINKIDFSNNSNLSMINYGTFYNTTLGSIIISSQIQDIKENAFLGCEIKKITIPKNVKTIGDYAFAGTYSLKTIEFEEGSKLNTISKGAFFESNLRKFIVPKSVSSIDKFAFGNNSKLKKITFEGNDIIEGLNKEAFSNALDFEIDYDDIEDIDSFELSKNKTVEEIVVDNYDVFKWIEDSGFFGSNAKVTSNNTRIFVQKGDKKKNKGDVPAGSEISFEEYIPLETGQHYSDKSYQYSNSLNEEELKTVNTEETKFNSEDYPFVILNADIENNTYDIMYDYNTENPADNIIPSTHCIYGNSITLSDIVPQRRGYLFLGWSKNKSGTEVMYSPGQIINENLTDKHNETIPLYAVWKKNSKKIKIHFSEPENKSADFMFNVKISKDGKLIQEHNINSSKIKDTVLEITGAIVGEKYLIECTNYKNTKGKKKYFATSSKEVTIE